MGTEEQRAQRNSGHRGNHQKCFYLYQGTEFIGGITEDDVKNKLFILFLSIFKCKIVKKI